jgi:hypothetical protein
VKKSPNDHKKSLKPSPNQFFSAKISPTSLDDFS